MSKLSRVVFSILMNQAHRFKFDKLIKRVLKKPSARGGRDLSKLNVKESAACSANIFNNLFKIITPFMDIKGKSGIEIGPGDNIGAAYSFLAHGAKKIYLIEKYDNINLNIKTIDILNELDQAYGRNTIKWSDVVEKNSDKYKFNPDKICIKTDLFENTNFADKVDFIYSNDVIEHVNNVRTVFLHSYNILKKDGIFINNIDFAGHNAFSNNKDPLDFLTCKDFMWNLMFSHLETTNKIRFSQVIEIAKDAGFEIFDTVILKKADENYVRSKRPHLRIPYRDYDIADLQILQAVIVMKKSILKNPHLDKNYAEYSISSSHPG